MTYSTYFHTVLGLNQIQIGMTPTAGSESQK